MTDKQWYQKRYQSGALHLIDGYRAQWTDAETNLARTMRRAGSANAEIAKAVQRTPKAVKRRLQRVAG